MHYWIVEHDIIDGRSEQHRNRRNELNDRFIGTLMHQEVAKVVVQGVEITKPSWFTEAEVDVDQLLVRRRKR